MNELEKREDRIRFVPETLYFTPPNRAWLSGQVFINGKQVGSGKATEFAPEDLLVLSKIITDVSIRHIQHLNQ